MNYRIGGSGSVAPEATANWTGLYIGGNGGAGTAIDRSAAPVAGTAGGPVVFDEAFNLSPAGYLGGIQIGYNWQAANWVFGVETDIQGSTPERQQGLPVYLQFSPRPSLSRTISGCPGSAPRGRGSAIRSDHRCFTPPAVWPMAQSRPISPPCCERPTKVEFSHTRTGWTAGAGIESPFELFGLFGKNWTAKTEYLYVDLGSSTNSNVLPGEYWKFQTHVQEHILRTGLNYHINSPIVARY